jgi:hypothetical protein
MIWPGNYCQAARSLQGHCRGQLLLTSLLYITAACPLGSAASFFFFFFFFFTDHLLATL